MMLEGRTALVSGASRGLGKAIALALADQGARVALVSRNRADLEKVAAEIGPRSAVFPADIAREEEVLRLEREVAAWGKVQILVNNAGINIRKNLTDFTLEEWNRVIGTNLTSVFLMCRAFVPHMQGTGYGRVINLTSTMAHVAMPQRTAYASSKTALLGLTRALALELAGEGITVNGISPGPFATEMNRPLIDNPETHKQFTAMVPVGRWGKVEEVGALAVYLCSEPAAYVTGTDVLIDGGWCAR